MQLSAYGAQQRPGLLMGLQLSGSHSCFAAAVTTPTVTFLSYGCTLSWGLTGVRGQA
ncbi:hypothetical protein D3C77_600310 [compost metagenome]